MSDNKIEVHLNIVWPVNYLPIKFSVGTEACNFSWA